MCITRLDREPTCFPCLIHQQADAFHQLGRSGPPEPVICLYWNPGGYTFTSCCLLGNDSGSCTSRCYTANLYFYPLVGDRCLSKLPRLTPPPHSLVSTMYSVQSSHKTCQQMSCYCVEQICSLGGRVAHKKEYCENVQNTLPLWGVVETPFLWYPWLFGTCSVH